MKKKKIYEDMLFRVIKIQRSMTLFVLEPPSKTGDGHYFIPNCYLAIVAHAADAKKREENRVGFANSNESIQIG